MFIRPLLLLTLLAALVAGCGSEAGSDPASSSTDVDQLLKDTFGNLDKITSANVSAKLAIQGQGQTVGATLSGPFQSQGAGKLPKFQLDAKLDSGGRSFTAGATWTGEKGYVNVQGTQYELSGMVARQFEAGYEQALKSGKAKSAGNGAVLSSLGIDFTKWLRDARNEGDAQVGDTETIKISGDADVARVIDDLQQLADKARALNLPGASRTPQKLTAAQRQEIADAIKKLSVQIYTGKADRVLRRVVVSADLLDTGSKQTSHVDFDLTLDKVGADQQITAPKDAKPFSELLKVTGGLEGLAGLGGSSSSGGATSAAGSKANIEKYAKCVEQAQGDAAKARKCADLLTG